MKTAITYVNTALSFLGRKETDGSHQSIIDIYNSHKPLARGYKVKYTDAWCATFVSAMAIKCGYIDIIPLECSCAKMVKKAQTMGIWIENDAHSPTPGDIIMYDNDDTGNGDNKGNPDHTGIVVSNNGGSLTIIEGNYKNAVRTRIIKVNDKGIRGYICPKFDKEEEIHTTIASGKKSYNDYAKTALDVITGKYGKGDARIENLTKQGYDASKVQRIVNAILS